MFLVLKGALTMTARDGLGRTAQVVRHGPGQFTGEVAQLSTGVAVVPHSRTRPNASARVASRSQRNSRSHSSLFPRSALHPALSAAIDGAWREPQSRARDAYRHPLRVIDVLGPEARHDGC